MAPATKGTLCRIRLPSESRREKLLHRVPRAVRRGHRRPSRRMNRSRGSIDRCGEVGQQVDDHDDDREEQRDALDDREVPIADRVEHQIAEPVDPKTCSTTTVPPTR